MMRRVALPLLRCLVFQRLGLKSLHRLVVEVVLRRVLLLLSCRLCLTLQTCYLRRGLCFLPGALSVVGTWRCDAMPITMFGFYTLKGGNSQNVQKAGNTPRPRAPPRSSAEPSRSFRASCG